MLWIVRETWGRERVCMWSSACLRARTQMHIVSLSFCGPPHWLKNCAQHLLLGIFPILSKDPMNPRSKKKENLPFNLSGILCTIQVRHNHLCFQIVKRCDLQCAGTPLQQTLQKKMWTPRTFNEMWMLVNIYNQKHTTLRQQVGHLQIRGTNAQQGKLCWPHHAHPHRQKPSPTWMLLHASCTAREIWFSAQNIPFALPMLCQAELHTKPAQATRTSV